MKTIGLSQVVPLILALLLLLSFYLDVRNVAQGGSIDLRNRITGVRLLLHDLDPYRYKWRPSDPPEYDDPSDNIGSPVSRTTVTPSLLVLQTPVAPMPYRWTQYLWMAIQWVLLFATAMLWWQRCETSRQRWWLAIFLTCFTFTCAWRLHCERGQAYLILIFLSACWLLFTLERERKTQLVAGMLAGSLVALRPSFAILVPYILLLRRSQLVGMVVGLALTAALPLMFNPSSWSDYFSAMHTRSVYFSVDDFPAYKAPASPAVIEGIPKNLLTNTAPIRSNDFSLYHFLLRLGTGPFPSWVLIMVYFCLFALWLWWSSSQSLETQMLGLTAWFFIADLFLPARRYSYNDVLIINVFALGLTTSARVSWALWFYLAALATGWFGYVNESTLLWMVGALCCLYPLAGKGEAARSDEARRFFPFDLSKLYWRSLGS